MRLSSFLKVIFFITFVCLIYINMQMRIIGLAYTGKEKENNINRLKNENDYLIYKVLSLKSSNHLGDKILQEDSKLQFAENKQIIYVAPSLTKIKTRQEVRLSLALPKKSSLTKWFSFTNAAEARINGK